MKLCLLSTKLDIELLAEVLGKLEEESKTMEIISDDGSIVCLSNGGFPRFPRLAPSSDLWAVSSWVLP